MGHGLRIRAALTVLQSRHPRVQYARQRALAKGTYVLQSNADKQRPAAKRFYESIGFVNSHESRLTFIFCPFSGR
jgi:hypothetical protein